MTWNLVQKNILRSHATDPNKLLTAKFLHWLIAEFDIFAF